MRKTLLALSLLSLAPLAHAADFAIGLSNKAVAADYTSLAIGQGLEFTAGGLHHSDHGNMLNVGLQVSQQVNSLFTVSVGGKAVAVLNDTKDASALALGGRLDLALPVAPQVHVGVHGWFAPKVTSTSGTKNYQDIGAYASYRIISNAEVFAAYRRIRIDYEQESDHTIQSGPLLGMKLYF